MEYDLLFGNIWQVSLTARIPTSDSASPFNLEFTSYDAFRERTFLTTGPLFVQSNMDLVMFVLPASAGFAP